MKKIGLIGGTSWISTIEYYRIINQEVNKRKGGLDFAELLIYSLNHGEFKTMLDKGDWTGIAGKFTDAAKRLESAGASCIIVCAATPHKIADNIRKSIFIPLIHIAEVVRDELKRNRMTKVGLIGTKFTMEEDFFKETLSLSQIDVIIPEQPDRDFIQATIFCELGKGIFSAGTKKKYLQIIDKLIKLGIESIIFGCTEFPLLIKQTECPITIIDPTVIHALAAVDFSLSN